MPPEVKMVFLGFEVGIEVDRSTSRTCDQCNYSPPSPQVLSGAGLTNCAGPENPCRQVE